MTVRGGVVLSVTVMWFPDATTSLIVAVMFTVSPALYEPAGVVDENAVTVGAVVSRVMERSNAGVRFFAASRKAAPAASISARTCANGLPAAIDRDPYVEVVQFAGGNADIKATFGTSQRLTTNGAPVRFVASPEKVAAKRQAREQQVAAQQLVQALPGVAAMTKAASDQQAA